jgi:hypothetical protein
MQRSRSSTLIGLLIVIVIAGAAYSVVQSFRNITRQAMAPFGGEQRSPNRVSALLNPPLSSRSVTYIQEVRAGGLETIQWRRK